MNKTLKLLILSDIFVLTGFGLINPILAIFIKDNITGGTIFTAGIASALFFITKVIFQIPIANYVDLHDHKLRWLIIGTFLIAAVPFIYMAANSIYMVYLAQIIYGIGAAAAYPTWLGIFSTHLDKNHCAYDWSVHSTLTGIGTAVTAALGSAIAEFVNFKVTFGLVGILSLIGCFILFGLERKNEKISGIPILDYHKKRKLVHGKHH